MKKKFSGLGDPCCRGTTDRGSIYTIAFGIVVVLGYILFTVFYGV